MERGKKKTIDDHLDVMDQLLQEASWLEITSILRKQLQGRVKSIQNIILKEHQKK